MPLPRTAPGPLPLRLPPLQVEPVQWPLHRVRRVLNAAVHSAITAQDLADAVAAVEEGYAGSLSRWVQGVCALGRCVCLGASGWPLGG